MVGAVSGYTILKTFHVLFAVTWVGGAIAINVLGTRAARSNDGPRIATFAGEAEWLGTHLYLPSSLMVLLFGILTVLNGHIGFTRLWVILGLAGIGATIITGSTVLGPTSKRISEIIGARGGDDPEAKRLIKRVLAVGRVDLTVLLLVIVDMVIKPGA
jgi:uncharacterized membrane protein